MFCKMNDRILVTIVVLLVVMMASIRPVMASLKCYTCSANTGGTDCEKNVATVSVTNCNKRYCTTRRIENKATNQVTSFYRNCEDNPMYMDKVIEDDTYRTFFRACAKALCNGGTGKESYVPDGGGNLPAGVTKPLFNDGVLHPFSSSSVKINSDVFLLVASVIIGIVVCFV